ncbi:MAG TPA: hypothetical protein VEA44_03390 [Caulobacter sp.]|nr:hypothetical protein [Caulobacter sp.]
MVHVAGGMVAILAGPIALLAPKGRWLHRKAGIAFYGSMLVMAGVALAMATIKVHKVNVAASALTLYLVITAWSIVRARPGTIGRVERWAPVAGAAIALAAFVTGALVAVMPGLYEGDPRAPEGPTVFFVVGAISALAAAADVLTLRRGGLAGAARVSRHLWRMCLPLFIAIASFAVQLPLMLERMDLAPPPGNAVFLVALAVPLLMVFWLIRVRIGRPAAAAGA